MVEESLRVRPVVPFTGRLLRQDSELGGYALPAGTVILVGIYLAHTRADNYPDPFAFRPERFLGDSPPETYSWIPFGGGTRRCIGAAFAQLEMRVAIETILSLGRPAPGLAAAGEAGPPQRHPLAGRRLQGDRAQPLIRSSRPITSGTCSRYAS